MPAPDDFSRAPEAPLFALLDRLGIRTATITHPKVFTVAESQSVKAHLPGGHTKNLFMKDKSGQLVLVCALGSSTLSLNQLHRALGCQRLSFTDAPLLWDALGVTPGSVTAFGLINDTGHRVRFVLDAALAAADPVNFHPLTNTATLSIKTPDLMRFFALANHAPMIVDLPQPPDGQSA